MKDYEEKVLNIMDSAKDNIRIQLDKAYKSGYEDAKSELGQNAIDLAHEESDRAYQRGLEEAWEAARKITLDDSLSLQKLMQIFETASFSKIIKENTASEAIAKIKEYEEQQKQYTKRLLEQEPYKGMTNGQVHDMLYQMLVELKDGADRYGAEKWWNSPYKGEQE